MSDMLRLDGQLIELVAAMDGKAKGYEQRAAENVQAIRDLFKQQIARTRELEGALAGLVGGGVCDTDDDHLRCVYCNNKSEWDADDSGTFSDLLHAADCPIVVARAVLATSAQELAT